MRRNIRTCFESQHKLRDVIACFVIYCFDRVNIDNDEKLKKKIILKNL